MAFHWLSFADPGRPKGTQFLGAVIVEAPSFAAAVGLAHMLGCNPGGECQGAEYPDDVPVPPAEFHGRLLDKAEIARLEARMAT